MNPRFKDGCTAGILGAAILVAIMYVMTAMGMGNPGFVKIGTLRKNFNLGF